MPIDRDALCRFLSANPWLALTEPPCVKPSSGAEPPVVEPPVVEPPVVDCNNYDIRFFKDEKLEDPVNIAEGIDYPEETIYAVVVNTETKEILGNVEWESVFSGDLKLAVVVFGGNIWTSTDSGATWVEDTSVGSPQNWRSITSSADGTKLAVVVFGGNIWTSDDSGNTWNVNAEVPKASLEAIASSSGVWGQETQAGPEKTKKAFKLGGVGQLGVADLTATVNGCMLTKNIEFSRCGTALAAHQAVIRAQARLETIDPLLVPVPPPNLRDALVAAFAGAQQLLSTGQSIEDIPGLITPMSPCKSCIWPHYQPR